MRRILLIGIAIIIGCGAGVMHIKSSEQYQYIRPEVETIEVKMVPVEEDPQEFEMHYINVVDIDPEIPDEIKRAAEFYGYEYNICPELLESMAWQETRFTADIASADGSCIGLMQVKPSCHKERMERLGVTIADLRTVDANMKVAADYLHELFEEYEDVGVVLMVYNGDSNYKTYAKTGKLSSYAKQILERSEEYEERHGKN